MEKEITYIKEHFGGKLIDERFGVYSARVGEHEVLSTVSGIGKVNSAVSTQRLIDKYLPDAVINVGVAGGLDRSLAVLDMVVAEDTMYHDFHPLSLLDEDKNLKSSVFKCDEKLVSLAVSALEKLKGEGKIKNFKKGRVVSGDCFVEDDEVSRRLREELSGACVEMEGASVSQTAILNSLPFLVIRCISDFADGNAGMSYDTFSDLAALQAGAVLEEIIKSL